MKIRRECGTYDIRDELLFTVRGENSVESKEDG